MYALYLYDIVKVPIRVLYGKVVCYDKFPKTSFRDIFFESETGSVEIYGSVQFLILKYKSYYKSLNVVIVLYKLPYKRWKMIFQTARNDIDLHILYVYIDTKTKWTLV